ncbi:MAG: class I SAM-dependent methyltransferase [Treponema sp.]|nr:class I SAM-dependent methyltransferase [Treponema sp.]
MANDFMEKNGVLQETVANTMLIPLWGRAFASKLNPQILDDSEAIKIINSLNYDFSEMEKNFGEFGGICYIIRARVLDDIIKKFIREYPNASIVNIGSGLDTTFSRIDNGSIHWYNLDLPEAIEFRKTLIPDSERNSAIPISVFDFTWFEKIKFESEKSILFIAAGVFYYFKENEVKELFCAMGERFPNGMLIFDAESKSAVKKSNSMVRKAGNKGARMFFYVNNPDKFEQWSKKIKLIDVLPFFKSIQKNKKWKLSTRILMVLCDVFKMTKFIVLQFK